MQAAKNGRFGLQTITVRLVHGDLEDQFFVLAIASYQQRVRRATAPEFADNDEAGVQVVVPLRDAGIDCRRGFLRSRVCLGQGEVFEELAGGSDPVTHDWGGGRAD
jgi:hypothetical protein